MGLSGKSGVSSSDVVALMFPRPAPRHCVQSIHEAGVWLAYTARHGQPHNPGKSLTVRGGGEERREGGK